MELKKEVTPWFIGPNTFFLFGAGCSRCAGKPLIDALTENVVQDLSPEVKLVFDNLRSNSGYKPNIEDLITHLLRTKGVISSMNNVNITHITENQIESGLTAIRKGIVKSIGYEWKNSIFHNKFFDRIKNKNGIREIFTLNYDIVIESSFEDSCIPYVDGFVGAENAYFDATLLDIDRSTLRGTFAMYKLHGSINWVAYPF